jgi:hypothetical protein
MELLGRVCNVIPIASGQPFKMRDASSAMIVVTGASAVITMTQANGFAGTPQTLLCIKNVYFSTQSNGTAAWAKGITWNVPATTPPPALLATYTHGTTAGLTTAVMTAFTIFTSELSDPFNYVIATATGSGLCSVITGDMVHQRTPSNLAILAA